MNWYGVIIAFSLMVGWLFWAKRCPNFISQKEWSRVFVASLVFGIIGARMYHVFDYFEYYKVHPIDVVKTWEGGLGVWGSIGTVGGLLLVWAKKSGWPVRAVFDVVVFPLPLVQALGRLANYANNEGFGLPTITYWGQYVPTQYRPVQYLYSEYFHPSWAYEAVLSLILFFVFVYLDKKGLTKKTGVLTGCYLIGYGIIRFGVEFTRFDTWMVDGVKIGQVCSVGAVVMGSIILACQRKVGKIQSP